MSNNNHPHGNLSQTAQNPSWNPLQIPSYIPRQPQLAHMSNERSLVRSPLAWHASTQPPPPTPDAIYNFMSANHKNLDHHHQMNPLLAPPYTGTLPFDSMDLSLQSSRSAAPALTKAGQQPQQQQSQQQQHQHQSHLHAPPNYPTIHNLTTNTPVGAQQGHLQGIPASASPSSAANKYLNANGAADCESLLPAPPSTPPNNNNNHNSNNNSTSTNTNSSSSSSSGNNNAPPPHYMQNRDENFKLTQLKNIQKNTELGSKECNYGTSGATGKLATHSMQHQQQNAKKPSPLRNYHQQQQQQQPQPYNVTKYNGPQTPPTHQSPLDYNQLHLHHQLHAGVGGYAPHQQQQQHQHMQEQQQQQQQQHHQHQQHLHYAPPQTLHNQHLAPPLLPPPPTSLIASAQFQQQQQLRQQQQTQLQQQLTPPPHSSPQQTHTTQMHSRNTQLTNLDILSKHKSTEEEHHGTNEETIITDLSTTTAAHRSSTNTEDKQLAEAPESPYMTTSNEESLESNSNSSNSRKRRKRKASQVMRLTPSDNAIVKRQRTPSPLSNSCSPKRSPKNGEFQPFKSMKEQQQQQQKDLELPQENGRATPPAVVAAADNSNSSTLYNDTTTDNPKTKKQRQALLQRNRTERQHQQQQHETGNQVADEHQPGATNAAIETTKLPPPSPHSNSSSSSSSSSSAVSHSSHSSQASETPIDKEKQHEQHQQQQHLDNNKAITDTPASPALVEQGDIDAKPAVSVHDDEDEVVSPAAKQSPLPVATAPSVTATTVATTDAADGADAVSTFNEVEDKLEQMFAGIEDEPAVQAADAARGPHDLSAHFSLDSDKSAELIKSAAGNAPATSVPNTPTTSTLMLTTEIRPVATKAAMKSKLPSPIHSPSPTVAVSVATSAVAAALPPIEMPPTATPAVPAIAVAASAKVVPRTPPTRCLPPRRLSMGMDPSLLRFTIGEQQKPKKTPGRKKQQPPPPPPLPTPLEMEIVQLDSDDDKPSTSAAAAAALAARKLSEATAAAAAAAALAAAAKTPANTKVNNTTKKQNKNNKKNTPKGKKPTGKSVAKQNGNKKSFASGGRKNFSTDEDSTPAPNGVTSAPDLRFKSPFILIKPDGSISIKNTHNAEDVNEKQTKKKHTKAPHERKNLRGMHSSTLSNRYDADTTDSSWICVFCKCGPHKLGLGDLFGPYLVSIDCEEYRTAVQVPAGSHDIDGLFVSKRKRADMVKVQQRNLPVVAATLANIMQAPKITMHKRKRKTTHDSVYSCSDDPNESQCSSQDPLDCSHETKFIETFRGMSKTSEHGYEIWLHEDCAVWANDIHLIGAHVNGLDAAVWESTRYQCVHCAQPGANICCFHRACKAAAHVPCARVASWSLSEQDRKVYCQLHAPDKSSEGPIATVAAPAAIPTTMSAINVEQTAAPPPTFNINSLP